MTNSDIINCMHLEKIFNSINIILVRSFDLILILHFIFLFCILNILVSDFLMKFQYSYEDDIDL